MENLLRKIEKRDESVKSLDFPYEKYRDGQRKIAKYCYSIAKNKNEFKIHYSATSKILTPVSMAPHTYWRLLGKDVLNHKLTINGNEVTKLDKELIILSYCNAKI